MINSGKWIETLPSSKNEKNQDLYSLDHEKWIQTVHKQKKLNPFKKYFLTASLFIVGLIFVSVIKNETRNLQKEIDNLQVSINTIKFDLHQTALDHEFITSPENIEKLAEEYLELNLKTYKKDQIKQLDGNSGNLKISKKSDNQLNLQEKTKLKIVKKIEEKKAELQELKKLYSEPKKIPNELKVQLTQKIEKKKMEINQLVNQPEQIITAKRLQKWAGIQVVKVFLGIPIVPGK
tara:strand:+ start:264 stop:968 length:705 start_codon:yes stop_codon:yes gene_type:complete